MPNWQCCPCQNGERIADSICCESNHEVFSFVLNAYSFRPKARTVDHLGRGQIADCPTAVSELWKNAYDAYAAKVSLQIFADEPVSAAIFDDGIGMDLRDITEKWLTLGTESKLDENEAVEPPPGFEKRVRQGEKGIGRLSVAFLSPITILLSKKAGQKIAGIAVDWRLFENPYADLVDIVLPTFEIDSSEEVASQLSSIKQTILSNLGLSDEGDRASQERRSRLKAAWAKYSEQTRKSHAQPVLESILGSWTSLPSLTDHFSIWSEFATNGTAILMFEVSGELSSLGLHSINDNERSEVRDNIYQTLTSFTDPYSEDRPRFEYEILIRSKLEEKSYLSTDSVFGLDRFKTLEHQIIGEFDENGRFTGELTVFGKSRGQTTYNPPQPLSRSKRDYIGPFQFCIGTFEQEAIRSTMTEESQAHYKELANKYSGFMVYRDSLRLMPYGRPDSDWLEMEEQRSRHAGRAFWAHRRVFGRIAFKHNENPNLTDKAGREGLVANRASRQLKLLLKDFLKTMANTYFGTDSEIRLSELPEIKARNRRLEQAVVKARQRLTTRVKKFVKAKQIILAAEIKRASVVTAKLVKAGKNKDRDLAEASALEFQSLVKSKDLLRPPSPTENLGDFFRAVPSLPRRLSRVFCKYR
jgi:hypothetical protein